MTKQVAYSLASMQILQWQDTDLFHYPEPPDDVALQPVTDDEWGRKEKLRWIVDGAPTEIEPELAIPDLTESEAEIVHLARRDQLLAEAAVIIAPLQDAADLEEATPLEASALRAWKRYRVALNRIHEQPGFPLIIDWPVPPTGGTRPAPDA